MRLNEFADAEAQLALLRIIIDNTWTAIAQQAEQQKRVDAERKAQAKLKPRAKKSSKGTSIRIPTPPPPPTKKPQAPLAKQQPPTLNKPNPNALDAVKPIPPANAQLKQPPTNTVTMPNQAATPYLKPTAATPLKPVNGLSMGDFGTNMGALEKVDDGDDRHSKNGIATLKK
jgi:hypothetical protein